MHRPELPRHNERLHDSTAADAPATKPGDWSTLKGYELPGGLDALFRPSTGDIIIGSKEEDRATKTFFQTERGALLVTLLGNHAESLVKRTAAMRALEGKPELDEAAFLEAYPGCKKWVNLHIQILKHYASVEGFAVAATVKLEQQKLMQATQKTESSVQTGDGAKGG